MLARGCPPAVPAGASAQQCVTLYSGGVASTSRGSVALDLSQYCHTHHRDHHAALLLVAPPPSSRLQQKIDLGVHQPTSFQRTIIEPSSRAHRPTKASYPRLFIAKAVPQCAGTRAIVRAEQSHSW